MASGVCQGHKLLTNLIWSAHSPQCKKDCLSCGIDICIPGCRTKKGNIKMCKIIQLYVNVVSQKLSHKICAYIGLSFCHSICFFLSIYLLIY